MARVEDWVRAHPRGLLVVGVLLALPYLVLCNGLAVFIVSSLLTGGCGG